MKFRPLGDFVLIDPIPESEKTQSGIMLPSGNPEREPQGTVVAVGRGYIQDSGAIVPLELKVGDFVYFDENGAESVIIDQHQYFRTRERYVLAIVELETEEASD